MIIYLLNKVMEILGVCNRLGQKSGIDRGLIQFAFIISLVLTGGATIVVYLLAHFLMD
jgi:phage shock protein PspC (stress-responsive transcriptional regulator)